MDRKNPETAPDQKTGLLRLAERCAVFIVLLAAYGTIMLQITSRMYWPYMLSSYFIATLVFMFYESHQLERRNFSALGNYLFPKDVWLHKSAVLDSALFLVNYYVFLVISAHYILTPEFVSGVFATASGATGDIMKALHVTRHTAPPGIIATFIYTFCAFMIAELSFYTWHRAMHKIPLLWEFHKVHHSAEVMTPLTYIRNHPFDLWVENLIRLFSLAICSGVFLYFYPGNRGAIIVASVDLGVFLTSILGANLHHSHIWWSFGSKLEHFFMSPAQHQIHHSNDRKHYDRNFGSMISFWDWLFGSLYIIRGREHVTFGLNEKEMEGYTSLLGLLITPIKKAWQFIR